MKLSKNNFKEVQLSFGSDTIWNSLRIIPMRCDGLPVKKQFGIVLE